jgi:ornithine cyclodeaminase
MREAGDLIPARSVEEWRNKSLTNLAELVRGSFTRDPSKPTLYTGAGMAWQDLVIASAIYARASNADPETSEQLSSLAAATHGQ